MKPYVITYSSKLDDIIMCGRDYSHDEESRELWSDGSIVVVYVIAESFIEAATRGLEAARKATT